MTAKKTILALSLAVLAPACLAAQRVADMAVTQPGRPPQAMAMAQPAAPVPSIADTRLESLGMGDMIRVTVFRNPELTTEARVSERGTIVFPMVGEVEVAGLTPSQAAQRIGDRLRAGRYVVNPEVTVSAMQVNSRQVSVLGSVVKPGRYPIDSTNMHLTDFLASAGGIAPTG